MLMLYIISHVFSYTDLVLLNLPQPVLNSTTDIFSLVLQYQVYI